MHCSFFLQQVPIDESGEGTGGYGKEMSDEYKKAQNDLFVKQAGEVDIIITSALIPGSSFMFDSMLIAITVRRSARCSTKITSFHYRFLERITNRNCIH